MEFPVRVFSVDGNGSTHSVSFLGPNFGSRAIDTYVGQTWLVTDEAGKPLVYFVAEKGREGEVGRARIGPDDWEDR
jgi:hypothetical protein